MIDVMTARLRDLETILIWEGEIDNLRVREVLGVKTVWASRLLAELAVRTANFTFRETSHSPLKVRPGAGPVQRISPDDYLRVITRSPVPGDNLEDCRKDFSVVSPSLFGLVAAAVRRGVGLRLLYRSMTQPLGVSRTIFPHVIVRAPRRWHVRAWCDTRQDFRDFNLGRMDGVQLLEDRSLHTRKEDKDWSTVVTIDVVAHPSLNEMQRKMIADEYFPGATARKLSMRRCLVGYIIQDLNIATEPEKQLPPQFQLCVSDARRILPLFPVT